jgi:hypothetical protein
LRPHLHVRRVRRHPQQGQYLPNVQNTHQVARQGVCRLGLNRKKLRRRRRRRRTGDEKQTNE